MPMRLGQESKIVLFEVQQLLINSTENEFCDN